jgi:hypothetical protein
MYRQRRIAVWARGAPTERTPSPGETLRHWLVRYHASVARSRGRWPAADFALAILQATAARWKARDSAEREARLKLGTKRRLGSDRSVAVLGREISADHCRMGSPVTPQVSVPFIPNPACLVAKNTDWLAVRTWCGLGLLRYGWPHSVQQRPD